jgi:hypothetical protein
MSGSMEGPIISPKENSTHIPQTLQSMCGYLRGQVRLGLTADIRGKSKPRAAMRTKLPLPQFHKLTAVEEELGA